MTEIKLTLDDPGMAARQLRHAANHWNDGAPKPNPVGDLLLAVADSIEEQVKPAIEEPTEFGSIVRAGVDGLSDRVLWARGGGHYWFSETIRRADFEDLYQPEVLRVGIGEPPEAEYHRGYEAGYGEGVNWGLAASRTPSHARFCTLRQDCHMADGHDGGCRP